MLPDVIVTNMKRRLTGVTTTMHAAVSAQLTQPRDFSLGVYGKIRNDAFPRVRWIDLLKHGWRKPEGKPFRIWHARRNNEMLLGVILRDVLRMKFKLVFTSAAIRRHSWMPRQLMQRMDALIAVTDKAAGWVPHVRAKAAHGVDLQTFSPPSRRPGPVKVGLFGRVRTEKGVDLFVNALCQVLPKHPDVEVFIVGYCALKDRAFQQELITKLTEHGIDGQVTFVGEVPFDQVADWYKRVDLCVACPHYEGFGMTPLEAMASGCAILATDTGAFSEFVDEGVNGHLVPVGDLSSLSEKLESLLADKTRLNEMGKAGRKRAEDLFSIDKEACAINGLYMEMWTNQNHE